MKNYINFRVIENAKTKSNAVKKLECGDISETHTLSDEVIEIITEYILESNKKENGNN